LFRKEEKKWSTETAADTAGNDATDGTGKIIS